MEKDWKKIVYTLAASESGDGLLGGKTSLNKALQATFTRRGLGREEKLRILSEVFERSFSTSLELTEAEAKAFLSVAYLQQDMFNEEFWNSFS